MCENPHDLKILGGILVDLSVFEYNNDKRPLLSAVVIRSGNNYEGDGFYKLAGGFETIQIKECIKFWSYDDNFHKFT